MDALLRARAAGPRHDPEERVIWYVVGVLSVIEHFLTPLVSPLYVLLASVLRALLPVQLALPLRQQQGVLVGVAPEDRSEAPVAQTVWTDPFVALVAQTVRQDILQRVRHSV